MEKSFLLRGDEKSFNYSVTTYDDELSQQRDYDKEFSLPITHAPSGNLDLDGVEVSSVDKPLPSSNVGFQLMLKMGWQVNTGLGARGQGRVDPIPLSQNLGKLGLGKLEEDQHWTDPNLIKRKELESEKEETPELQQMRESKVEKERQVKETVEEMNKVFYCQLCDKQYQRITEYETHLSSYDHHHKKRLQEMRQQERIRSGAAKSKMKEKKREEKELHMLMQQAEKMRAGGSQPTAPQPSPSPAPISQPTPLPTLPDQPPPPPPQQPPPPEGDKPNPPPVKFSMSAQKSGVKFSMGAINKKPRFSYTDFVLAMIGNHVKCFCIS